MLKPKLVFLVEPESKFRFRYDSESKNNSHGGIPGKGKAEDGKKLYPTVQLLNYFEDKEVYIRVSVCTKEGEKHSPSNMLELKGKVVKSTKDNGWYKDGMYHQELGENFTATFKSLNILSKKQKEIMDHLMKQKNKEQGTKIKSTARTRLEEQHKSEIKDKAKDIMNSVTLCFEVSTRKDFRELICDPLFSNTIDNLKSTEKGNFKIHHLSHYSGTCKGGDRIILLCDKVQKDKVKVLFFETDGSTVIWQNYAELKEVFSQVAIILQTPPYVENTEKEVDVCLEREGEQSNCVKYRYIPNDNDVFHSSKKRKQEIYFDSTVCSSLQPILTDDTPSPSSNDNSLHTEQGNVLPQNFFTLPHSYSFHPIDSSNSSQFCLEQSESLYYQPLADPVNSSFEDSVGKEATVDGPDAMDVQFDDFSLDFSSSEREMFEQLYTDMKVSELLPGILHQNEIDGYQPDGVSHSVQNQSDNSNIVEFLSECISSSSRYKQNVPVAPYKENFNHRGASMLDADFSELTLVENVENTSLKRSNLMIQQKTSKIFYGKLKEKCLKLMNVRDEYNNTLLHRAVYQKMNKDVAEILKVSKIVNYDIVNIKNRSSRTAVHIATEKNDCQNLSMILKHGGNPNIKDSNGNNCLHIAAEQNSFNCMEQIITLGQIDVNAFNNEGLTPLHVSVIKSSIECVQLLVNYADVNAKDKRSGRSVLHYAIDMTPFLLAVILKCDGIDVNIQDFAGNTPLHIASASGKIDAVKQLLEAGADPLLRNFKLNCSTSDEESEEPENTDDDEEAGELALDAASKSEVQFWRNSLRDDVIIYSAYWKCCTTEECTTLYLQGVRD